MVDSNVPAWRFDPWEALDRIRERTPATPATPATPGRKPLMGKPPHGVEGAATRCYALLREHEDPPVVGPASARSPRLPACRSLRPGRSARRSASTTAV